MKRGVTLKDIASKLNMSISTVSKALNEDEYISGMTKERVKRLAEKWNYIPNEVARHFKQSKTFTLGLVIPNMLDQFYAMAVNGAEEAAANEKYNVIISQSHEDPANEEKIVDLMKRNRVDGLIIAVTTKTQDMSSFQKLESIGIPVVFFARPPKDECFDYVAADNYEGAVKATEFLIKKGHKRIGHFMGPECMAVSQLRLKGYRMALQKNKIEFDPALVKVVDFTEESNFLAMSKFMKTEPAPTAFFAFKNYISLDAIKYLKKYFPAKVGMIDFTGFGNLPLFRYLDHKPIASIEENSFRIGLEAAQLLFRNIYLAEKEEEKVSQHVKVACQLVVHN